MEPVCWGSGFPGSGLPDGVLGPGCLLGTHVGPIPADGVWREQGQAKGGAELWCHLQEGLSRRNDPSELFYVPPKWPGFHTVP